MHHAVRGGHDSVVQLLIKEDSQLCDIINAADKSPLYLATNRGLSCITELILGAFSWSSSHKGPKGLTALHVGISLSLTSWEKIMEKTPEAIREGDDMGRTPLHYIAYFGKVEAVPLILQRDTSAVYDLDKEGQSALHIAAFRGHIKVIDELVKFCPDACDMTNAKDQTVLHAAVIGGQGNVVKHILGMPNQEDLINEQDTDGNTALHLAALHKEYDIINILAQDKRMDRWTKNRAHLTALNIFSAHKETDVGAINVSRLLEGSHGIAGFQGWLIERGDRQFVEGRLSVSIKESITEVQLILAAFIATVTFTPAFQVPGGYINDGPHRGRAILADRADFNVFTVSNAVAFIFSLRAIITQFHKPKSSYIFLTVGTSLQVATFGMMLAYVSGLHATFYMPNGGTGRRIFELFRIVTTAIVFCLLTYFDGVVVWLLQLLFPARYSESRGGSVRHD